MKIFQTIDKLNAFLDMKLQDASKPEEERRNHQVLENMQAMEKTSGKMVSWSLSLLGGSFLAILSDEFVHPEVMLYKIGYLLFIPGWLLTIISINYGLKVALWTSAAHRNESMSELLKGGFKKCNRALGYQINCFKAALIIFGLWLGAYLIWWVFTEIPIKKLINL